MKTSVVCKSAIGCLFLLLLAGRTAWGAEAKRVVVPFDFQSKFDEGRYGQMVGDMLWKMLEREKRYILPESMEDVRQLCQANHIELGPDTPLDRVKQIVRRDFDAEIAIWGSVERVAGHEGDVYDLSIRCVDFTAESEPRVIYELSGARTKTVSEIPHLYAKQLLDRLANRSPDAPPASNPAAEEAWRTAPNLIVGGDFERADSGVPVGWEDRAGQQREPLGSLVRWLPETENPQNHLIRLTLSKEVGDNEGVMYYSREFPVEPGATYRFECRYRTNGPAVKVFIKCYDETTTPYQADGSPRSGRGYERRDVYRRQQDLKGEKNVWNMQREDFVPRNTRYQPHWGRVMLYAYLGAGEVEFDDVVVKQILPASQGDEARAPRHSQESKVTIKQMEENEARGRALRQKEKRAEGK